MVEVRSAGERVLAGESGAGARALSPALGADRASRADDESCDQEQRVMKIDRIRLDLSPGAPRGAERLDASRVVALEKN
jgi:hypothetical protein